MILGNLSESKFTKKQFKVPEAGVYYATITATDVRTAKSSGNKYLNVKMELTDKDGNYVGNMFDMISDSDKPFVQYKNRKFIEACGIPCVGEMELADLGMLIMNKKIVVWTKEDEWNGNKRLAVELKDSEGYYPAAEFSKAYNLYNGITEDAGPDIGMPAPIEDSFAHIDEAQNEELPFDDF